KPATEPLEFSPQIALLRTAGGPAGFDQGLAEPGIAFAGACAPSFASTLFIGGANSSPGCQVAYRRKVGQEVSAHLRNHDLSGPCAHPRNSVETFDLIGKRAPHLPHCGIASPDAFAYGLKLGQLLGHHD